MYRAAEKAGAKHMVGYNYRFIPAIRLARQFIQEGKLGKIIEFRAAYLQDWIMDPKLSARLEVAEIACWKRGARGYGNPHHRSRSVPGWGCRFDSRDDEDPHHAEASAG